jgi:hypothetical protein
MNGRKICDGRSESIKGTDAYNKCQIKLIKT